MARVNVGHDGSWQLTCGVFRLDQVTGWTSNSSGTYILMSGSLSLRCHGLNAVLFL